MKQRGYLMIGLAIALAIATVACLGLWNRLGAAHKEIAKVTGQFEAFKTGVADAGKKAEADKAKALKDQKEIHDAIVKDWSARHYALGVKFAGLRNGAGASAGSSDVPPAPETARPTDDVTRDNRLLDLLQHAEITTLKLIELQAYVTQLCKIRECI